MARRVVEFPVILKVEYIPIPEDRVGAWRTCLLLLLQIMDEVNDETLDGGRNGHAGRVWAALFSLAGIAQGKEAASHRRIHAWYIGNDGSAYRVVVDAWRYGSD